MGVNGVNAPKTMEYDELLREIDLVRRALALRDRIGRLYSYCDAYYLTPVDVDLSDPFGSARRISRAALRVLVEAAETGQAHDVRPGPARANSLVENRERHVAKKSNQR
jgi:hypothetical protein